MPYFLILERCHATFSTEGHITMSELELRREARKADCRKLVEAAMRNLIEQLHSKGFSQAAVALALADAAEEYVIELAAKPARIH